MQKGNVLDRELLSKADGAELAHTDEAQAQAVVSLDDERDGEHAGFNPRGILVFLFVMLIGYALYWAYLWFITVIERGVNG